MGSCISWVVLGIVLCLHEWVWFCDSGFAFCLLGSYLNLGYLGGIIYVCVWGFDCGLIDLVFYVLACWVASCGWVWRGVFALRFELSW